MSAIPPPPLFEKVAPQDAAHAIAEIREIEGFETPPVEQKPRRPGDRARQVVSASLFSGLLLAGAALLFATRARRRRLARGWYRLVRNRAVALVSA
jgi:hypothetical protein